MVIDPLPQRDEWTARLRHMAEQPLEFCPDFPAIAKRLEAWWAHDALDRPVIMGSANPNPRRPINRRLELLAQPDSWFEAKLADMKQQYRVGEALPFIRADFGPVMLGGMLGGRTEFGADTTWTHAFIDDDWSNAPDWALRDDNPWFALLQELAERVCADAAGRYLLCTPDLGGSADVLLNLRGSEPLCLDVLEQPERIASAVVAIYPAWRRAFARLYEIAHQHGAGSIHWLGLWSNEPYMIPACDFNFLIGPREFERLFLPDIARQAATAGRAIFHLDGPGAARHVDALLDLPELQAIQFVPGAGTPSTRPWIEMFRTIQRRGRAVLVMCPPHEVFELCDALRPEGLAIAIEGALTPTELDQLFEQFCRRYG
jgi:hypothetical protein